jgi:alpha-beta hydrolase superfamily lysophospholipase
VICLHGIISHGGWYVTSCGHLAEQGFEVHFVDRRGSGLNSPPRGDVDRFETWMTDVEDYASRLPDDAPKLLVGISWGGKLAAAIGKRGRHPFAGLALVTPGIAAQTKANLFQRRLLRFAGRAGLERRRVTIPLQDPALFTEVSAWQDYIRTDPLTLRRITIRFALADVALDQYMADSATKIRLPTLVMLAGRDRIIDNAGVRRFHDQLATPRKQLIEYPQAAHTLEFEPDSRRFFDELTDWLRQTAGQV